MNGLQSSLCDIDGVQVAVHEGGTGDPLLLVHGLGGAQMWQRVAPLLSERFRVIIPDLPGFGNSPPPPSLYSSNEYAECISSLVEKQGIGTISLAGISYGGEIAALYASRYPRRVGKLILIASTGFNEARWFAQNDIRWMLASGILKRTLLRSKMLLAYSGARSFHDIRNRPADFVENFFGHLAEEGKKDALLQCARNIASRQRDFPDNLARIASPALIVWGSHDRVVPLKCASAFRDRIAGAKIKVISDCGHSVPLEKPEELCREMFEFIL